MIKNQFLLLLSSELPAPAGCLSWAVIAVQSHSLRKGCFVRQGEIWAGKDAQPWAGLNGALICLVQMVLFAYKQPLPAVDEDVLCVQAAWDCKSTRCWCQCPFGCVTVREKCCKGSNYSQSLQGLQPLLGLLSPPLHPVRKERHQLIRHGRDFLPDKKASRCLNVY